MTMVNWSVFQWTPTWIVYRLLGAQKCQVLDARQWQKDINDILIICQLYSFVMGERHVFNMFVLQAVEKVLELSLTNLISINYWRILLNGVLEKNMPVYQNILTLVISSSYKEKDMQCY